MAFCTNCGTELPEGAKTCPNCGTASATEPEVKKSLDSILDTPEVEVDPTDANNNKVMGVLAYLGILVLIPILAAKESPFARYHANQGLVLWIAEMIAGVVGSILVLIPILGGLLSTALSLASLALTIIGIVNVCNGKAKELPLIGKFTLLK